MTSGDRYWPEALEAAGISVLVAAGACRGRRQGRCEGRQRRCWDLPEGIPVAGGHGQTAARAGRGAAEPGRGDGNHRHRAGDGRLPEHPAFPRERRDEVYRHALPGGRLYLPIGNTRAWRFAGSGCVLPGPARRGCARAAHREAAAVPLGCEGVTFFALFLAGAPDQGRMSRRAGAFLTARACPPRGRIWRAA